MDSIGGWGEAASASKLSKTGAGDDTELDEMFSDWLCFQFSYVDVFCRVMPLTVVYVFASKLTAMVNTATAMVNKATTKTNCDETFAA